jgi:hypothetical protein
MIKVDEQVCFTGFDDLYEKMLAFLEIKFSAKSFKMK